MHILLFLIAAGLILGVGLWTMRRRAQARLNEIERFFIVFSGFTATCCAFAGYMAHFS